MKRTATCITVGLILSVLILTPDWSYQNQLNWKIADTALSHLTQGLIYIDAFLHEVFHSIFNWFYGYPYTPVIDLMHGGGSVHTISKNSYLSYLLYPLLAFGLYYWKRNKKEIVILLSVGLFHSITAYNNSHEIIMIISGYSLTIILGSFFLNRAWSNTAPRGEIERYLNSTIGFSLILHNMLVFWGIYQGRIIEVIYNPNKPSVRLHDFNQLHAALPHFSIQEIAYYGVLMCCVALILPIMLYALAQIGLFSFIKRKFM